MSGDGHEEELVVPSALEEFLDRCEDKFPSLLSGIAAAAYLGISVAMLDGLSATNPLLRPVESCGRLAWKLSDLEAYVRTLPPGEREPNEDLWEVEQHKW